MPKIFKNNLEKLSNSPNFIDQVNLPLNKLDKTNNFLNKHNPELNLKNIRNFSINYTNSTNYKIDELRQLLLNEKYFECEKQCNELIKSNFARLCMGFFLKYSGFETLGTWPSGS